MSTTDTISPVAITNQELRLKSNLVTDERFNTLPPEDRWMVAAACADETTELFFSDEFDDVVAAKMICLDCPVRARCLDAAVERKEQFGIWGGHLFEGGRIVLEKRRRGRPRHVPRAEDTLPTVELPSAYRDLVTTA